jgi:hypothetical protein
MTLGDPGPGREHLFFVSMMRSGHHAVLNWFARNQHRPILHYNDCHLEAGALRPDPPNLVMYYDGPTSRYLLDETPERLDALKRECATSILSFEERDADYVREAEVIARPTKVILVVRDALNFIASCMKHAEKYPQVTPKIIATMEHRLAIWCEHARELQRGPVGNRGAINYNRWFASRDYRDALAAQHGFVNQDIGVEEVLLFGNGSSFDDLDFDQRASRMAVLGRWEAYRDDPRFRSYITPEVADLTASVFGIAVA